MISNKSLRNVKWLDATLFVFLLTLFHSLVYGLVLTMMHMHFILCVKSIILIVTYGYSYWIVKHCSDIMFFSDRARFLPKNPKKNFWALLCPKMSFFEVFGDFLENASLQKCSLDHCLQLL